MEITTILLIMAAFALGFAGAWIMGRKQFSGGIHEKASLSAKLEMTIQELDSLKDELEHARSERTKFHERVVTAETKNQLLEIELEKTQEKLRLEFKDTANNIFTDFSNKFTVESEKKIGDLLNPLRTKLGDFEKLVNDSFTAQGKEQYSLKTEIEKIVLQTDGLTKALRGDNKAQGNWGEVMLERILEQSGLRKGEEYTVQAAGMGLASETGGRLQPDVIVNLPGGKHVIIDSKVSLTAYERYCNETDETTKLVLVKEFVKSIKAHVNGLESKKYAGIDKLDSPDVVMMFMPIEGAFSLAVQSDSELHSYAWGKKIGIVGPTTLFASLKTISSIWNIERGNRNVDEILRQGGALYDKFAGFIGDMEEINKHINNLHKAYDNASNKLSGGRGNLIGQVEKLKQLGAKASKSLPKSKEELEEEVEV